MLVNIETKLVVKLKGPKARTLKKLRQIIKLDKMNTKLTIMIILVKFLRDEHISESTLAPDFLFVFDSEPRS